MTLYGIASLFSVCVYGILTVAYPCHSEHDELHEVANLHKYVRDRMLKTGKVNTYSKS